MTEKTDERVTAGASTTASRPALTQANLVLMCLVGVLVAQLHHLRDLRQTGGWSELPTYLVTGALSYGLISIGLAVVRGRRTAAAAVGLVYAAVAFLTFYVVYWTAWPVAASLSAMLLARGDGRRGTKTVAVVLAGLTLVASVAVVIYRAAGGTYQTGS